MKAGGFGAREVFIRVNGIDTPWHADDLTRGRARRAGRASWCRRSARVEQLERIGQRLLDMNTDHKTRIWAMIETPEAIFNINALAAEARDSETRLAGFVMGTNDLAKETRARLVPGRAPMLSWLATCLLAARAYGIDILDGVYNDIGDAEGFEAECVQARDMGFDGKTLIHPNQIEPCNAAFSPSRRRGRAGAQDHRRVRPAGEQGQGRGADRRPHGRAHACRDGAAHGRDRRGDRGERRTA